MVQHFITTALSGSTLVYMNPRATIPPSRPAADTSLSLFQPPHPSVPVAQYLRLQLPLIRPCIGTLAHATPNSLPSLLHVPSITTIAAIQKDLSKLENGEGSRKLAIRLEGYGQMSECLFPPWALSYWRDVHDQWTVREDPQRGLRFIKEQVVAADARGAAGIGVKERMLEAYFVLSSAGWKQSLFGDHLPRFDHDTLLLLPLLNADTLASLDQPHCALIALKARYHFLASQVTIVHLTFDNAIVNSFELGSTVVAASVVGAADWLRENRSRTIACLVHVNGNHCFVNGAGHITPSDSKSSAALPSWWEYKEHAWSGFVKLIDSELHLKVSYDGCLTQTDDINCGIAAIYTFRRFLDPTSAMWHEDGADVARVDLVLDVMTVASVS